MVAPANRVKKLLRTNYSESSIAISSRLPLLRNLAVGRKAIHQMRQDLRDRGLGLIRRYTCGTCHLLQSIAAWNLIHLIVGNGQVSPFPTHQETKSPIPFSWKKLKDALETTRLALNHLHEASGDRIGILPNRLPTA